jgi:hypothetical protein
MSALGTQALILAASSSAVAGLAHLACIALGPRAYRAMGAGERMALAVEAGKLRPTLVTLGIAGVLLLWSAYALAGAGVIGGLPFVRFVLPGISAVFLARAVAFPLLKPAFPENSETFWWVSSAICGAIGTLYLVGTLAVWEVV